MNKNGTLQFIKSVAWIITYVCTLCIIITGVILVGRLGEFITTEKTRTVIQLNKESAKVTSQSSTENVGNTTPSQQPETNTKQPVTNTRPVTPAKPGFEASDAQSVWEQVQEVEIFKIKYDETGNISVDGVDDKVIAPGTSNIYNFTFRNTGNVGLKYTLTTEVEFSNNEHVLPITVRLYDQNERYLIGNKDTFDDVQKLNIVSDAAELSPKSYSNYAFEWRWPYEGGNDEYDTFLGNLAVNEELTMTVKIKVRAEADEDASGGIPYTGDDSNIIIPIVLFVLSGVGIVAMLVIIRKGRVKAEDE